MNLKGPSEGLRGPWEGDLASGIEVPQEVGGPTGIPEGNPDDSVIGPGRKVAFAHIGKVLRGFS